VKGAITLAALVFICALGFGTVYVMVTSGPDVLTGLSLIVLFLMTFGILGALMEPPDKRR
jgi:hypothetical protein